MNRRTLLQLIPAAALTRPLLAQSHCGGDTGDAANPHQLQFFTPEEAALVDMLMEKIIPADGHSPGAHSARVVEFTDLMVSSSEDYVKQDWRSALALIQAELKTRSAEEWLEDASRNEANPQTVLDIFFRTLKQMTVNGYYSSAIGIHQDLKYQGNTYVKVFAGCDHPEHQN